MRGIMTDPHTDNVEAIIGQCRNAAWQGHWDHTILPAKGLGVNRQNSINGLV